jgi:hypothetical protein
MLATFALKDEEWGWWLASRDLWRSNMDSQSRGGSTQEGRQSAPTSQSELTQTGFLAERPQKTGLFAKAMREFLSPRRVLFGSCPSGLKPSVFLIDPIASLIGGEPIVQ